MKKYQKFKVIIPREAIVTETYYIEKGEYLGSIIDIEQREKSILLRIKVENEPDTVFVGFINLYMDYQPRDFLEDIIHKTGDDSSDVFLDRRVMFEVDDYEKKNHQLASRIVFIDDNEDGKYDEEEE